MTSTSTLSLAFMLQEVGNGPSYVPPQPLVVKEKDEQKRFFSSSSLSIEITLTFAYVN